MADARLRIVIDALNKAGDDLDKLKKDLKCVDQEAGKAEKSTGKFGGGLTSMMTTAAMVAGAVTAVSLAMKQVYETAREGADLLYVEDRFDNLTDSINTTSDALMNDLRVATRGLKSDAELMQGAMDFMSLGLAKSHDEVVRLTNVAGALDMNMNQLVLTLTNRTTMRFDALGVAVDGFDEKVKTLEESGLSAEEAFTEAFLQQAEEQIERVGHAADSATGDFQRFEAAVKNGTDNMKMQIAEVLAPAIGNLADKMENARTAQDNLRMAMEYGIITLDDFNRLASHEGMQRYGDEISEVSDKVDDFTDSIDENAEANRYAKDPYYQNADALTEFWTQAWEAEAAVKALTDATYGFAKDALKELGKGLDENQVLADLMALTFGDLTLEEIAVRDATDEATRAYNDGLLTMPEYIAALEDIAAGSSEVETAAGKAAGAVWTLSDALKNMPRETRTKLLIEQYTYQTGSNVYGQTGREAEEGDYEDIGLATGGPASANNPYIWQEYGYRGEMFVPSQNGYVLSRADAKRLITEAAGMRGQGGYSGPSAEDIARAVRDAMLMVN